MIDVASLAVPLAGDSPAGENCEYDPLYLELDSLSQDVPASQMGDSTLEGRAPDWKKLSKNCLELWQRTRDLRVAVYLIIAETVVNGLPELDNGLKLLNYLASDLWDGFYPKLDPNDDNDPTERLNILAMLSPTEGSYNDPIMFTARFRDIRLSARLPYTLRDLMIASGEIEAVKKVDGKLIQAELMNVPIAEIEQARNLVFEVREQIVLLCKNINEKIGENYNLSMDSLEREAGRLLNFYDQYLNSFARGGESEQLEGETQAPQNVSPANFSKNAASRMEALLMLKKGAEYFQQEEPSSPIPLLVNRALRFSEMGFLDLLQDIAPDAVNRGREIFGLKESDNNN
ncbi:MAG: type VI secretion system protein TssA [Deferribacteraceae bacterium]|jgi:type VI secretion system protein ImpA|nr:type VI secretion system protein TssA [Deferribacteraceae bacterium]